MLKFREWPPVPDSIEFSDGAAMMIKDASDAKAWKQIRELGNQCGGLITANVFNRDLRDSIEQTLIEDVHRISDQPGAPGTFSDGLQLGSMQEQEAVYRVNTRLKEHVL